MAYSLRSQHNGRGKLLESRDPLLTDIARHLVDQVEVDALAAHLLYEIPPHGPAFIKQIVDKNPSCPWAIVATNVLRCWCDHSEEPYGQRLHEVLKRIGTQQLAVKFREELLHDEDSMKAQTYPQKMGEENVWAALRFQSGVHQYQNKLNSGTRSSCLPFGDKWLPSPVPIKSPHHRRLLAVVLHDHLYVLAECEDHSNKMWSTSNLQEWKLVELQPTLKCVSAVSCHNNCLFCIADASNPNEDKRCLYWLKAQGKKCSVDPAENGVCPYQHCCESVIAIGNSILLFGGADDRDSVRDVAEYNTLKAKWITDTKWPSLPTALHAATPLLSSTALHLFGGCVVTGGKVTCNSTVFTVSLENGQPTSSAWRDSDIPRTPHSACAALQVHHHYFVAGGRDATQKVYWDSCYALDEATKCWLHLPPLLTSRAMLTVVHFRQFLVAVGGSSWKPWHKLHTDVESWHTE